MALLESTPQGIYCAQGDFFIDPLRGVDRAVLTHAHSDHARPGSRSYLCAQSSLGLLKVRLGGRASLQGLGYGETINCRGVQVSLHPAGHVLGSAQVRVEYAGEIWVVSGDYKREPDSTCAPFELLRCHTFITESTFALPIFQWAPTQKVFAAMNRWWRQNQMASRTSVVHAYSIGKAQRLLASLDASIGPLLAHPAVMDMLPPYRAEGVSLPPVLEASVENLRASRGRGLLVTPTLAGPLEWMDALSPYAEAAASGWMLVSKFRQQRRRVRGFVLSDHVDWPSLLDTIDGTGAERVLATHGFVQPLVRWLRSTGRQADPLDATHEQRPDPAAADLLLETMDGENEGAA